MRTWATLRQVALATEDIAVTGALLRERWGLGKGFTDPELVAAGVADETMPLRDGAFLELVSPLSAGSGLARRLEEIGPGGYALSIQHPNVDRVRRLARVNGVRVLADFEVMGYRVLRLHHDDMGAQLEVAGITDPAAWFWDELGAAPEPEALVDDVLGVEIGVAEPGLVADRWQKLLEVSRPVGDTLELGERFVRFVPPERAPRWRLLVRRAPTGGELSDEIVAGVDVSYF